MKYLINLSSCTFQESCDIKKELEKYDPNAIVNNYASGADSGNFTAVLTNISEEEMVMLQLTVSGVNLVDYLNNDVRRYQLKLRGNDTTGKFEIDKVADINPVK